MALAVLYWGSYALAGLCTNCLTDSHPFSMFSFSYSVGLMVNPPAIMWAVFFLLLYCWWAPDNRWWQHRMVIMCKAICTIIHISYHHSTSSTALTSFSLHQLLNLLTLRTVSVSVSSVTAPPVYLLPVNLVIMYHIWLVTGEYEPNNWTLNTALWDPLVSFSKRAYISSQIFSHYGAVD